MHVTPHDCSADHLEPIELDQGPLFVKVGDLYLNPLAISRVRVERGDPHRLFIWFSGVAFDGVPDHEILTGAEAHEFDAWLFENAEKLSAPEFPPTTDRGRALAAQER